MNKFVPILLGLFILFFISCTQKTIIRALKPAEITEAAALKRITVVNFKNDSVGLSGTIETTLSKRTFNNKPFFTLVSRKNFDKILKEQKLSGLLDESTEVELGKLLGAEALIAGEVDSGSDDQHYSKSKLRCVFYKKNKCQNWMTIRVNCIKRVVNLSANLRIIDISKGNIIYTNSFSEEIESKKCNDDSYGNLISKTSALHNLSRRIAEKFAYKLTPNYINFEVVLLDSPQIKYNDLQDDLLENGLAFIKKNNLKKAKSLLEQLHQSTNGKSMVAAYDLGVVHESLGNYQEAKIYYDIADNLQKKPIEAINKAVNRIATLIKDQKQTQQQLKK